MASVFTVMSTFKTLVDIWAERERERVRVRERERKREREGEKEGKREGVKEKFRRDGADKHSAKPGKELKQDISIAR